MTTRKELVEALRLRYRSAVFSDRIKILDEFVALTCYHRKHAIRVLRGEFSPATEVRLRKRVYGEAALSTDERHPLSCTHPRKAAARTLT